MRAEWPDQVEITTKRRLGEVNGTHRPQLIARTGEYITYRHEQPALALIDIDTKGMSEPTADQVREAGGFWRALVRVLPELATAGCVTRRSTSSGITRNDTNERLPGSNGIHIYVLVKDAADIERFLRTIHERCWLHG